ncbi:Glu/Leu/Phe/Val dehydrogenase dimerization domain-containing protein [Streptomyces sp. NPDC054796]
MSVLQAAATGSSTGTGTGTGRHENVVFHNDPETGLRAIVAIHSTVLGPALGGTRFFPYARESDALHDVLALSRGMTYKNALAGLGLGGGKAVIIGDPAADRTDALMRAYGRFVDSLNGAYITAADVGTDSGDMDLVARETRHVVGRSAGKGGCGDTSVLTAYGVLQGMRAAAEQVWGSARLQGRRVGVEGVGKVGSRLVGLLLEAGAHVVCWDADARAPARALGTLSRTRPYGDRVEIVPKGSTRPVHADLDIYAPCALSGAIDETVAESLTASVVCGAANCQLPHPGIADILRERGVRYVPDYLVNSGGVIQAADELRGFDMTRAKRRASRIFQTVRQVLALSTARGITTLAAAGLLAERRIGGSCGGLGPALTGSGVPGIAYPGGPERLAPRTPPSTVPRAVRKGRP